MTTAGLKGATKANKVKAREAEKNKRPRADARADAADRAEAADEQASGEDTEAFPDSSDEETRRSRPAVNYADGGKGTKGGKSGGPRKKSKWVAAVPGEFTKEAADEAEEDKTWWSVCGSLLRSLRTKRGYAFFEEPVDPVALRCPDYFDVVTKPMSFSVVQSRLDARRFAAAAAAAAAEADDADRQTKRQRTLASLSTSGLAGVAPYTSPTEFATDMVQVRCTLNSTSGRCRHECHGGAVCTHRAQSTSVEPSAICLPTAGASCEACVARWTTERVAKQPFRGLDAVQFSTHLTLPFPLFAIYLHGSCGSLRLRAHASGLPACPAEATGLRLRRCICSLRCSKTP
jgi:hypothetical protein